MFGIGSKKPQKRTMDDEVDRIVEWLKDKDPNDPEYAKAVVNLETVCNARSYKSEKTIPWETIGSLAVSLIEVIAVLNHEQLHVISSKAFGWILRPKA